MVVGNDYYFVTNIRGLETSAGGFSGLYSLFENLGINMRLGPAIDPRTNNTLLYERDLVGIYMKKEEGNLVKILEDQKINLYNALITMIKSGRNKEEEDF